MAIVVVLLPAQSASAGGCFPDLYYTAMFTPVAQHAFEGGDTRLVGMSDYLAAKGEDPHDKGGSGCMCGVNNGRWDQVLANRSNLDFARAPVTFKIDGISAALFDRKGRSLGTGFEINPSAVSKCLDSALKIKGWNPWQRGLLSKADLLEPGENILGCICLKPSDRGKSGFVKLTVRYTPLALALRVPSPEAESTISKKRLTITDTYKIENMPAGAARYFRIMPPPRAEGKLLAVDAQLAQAQGLDLFTSPDWQDMQSAWQKGSFKAVEVKPGGIWVLVRARDEAAQGKLVIRLSYKLQGNSVRKPTKPGPAGIERINLGPSAVRTFKSYVLGMASKTRNLLETATQRPCCDGTRRP